MDKSLVTSVQLSKKLFSIMGNNSLLAWKNENDNTIVLNDHSAGQIPCYTSEEIKRKLIQYKEDVTYYYEEKTFYFINYLIEVKPNDLPIHVLASTEVECRARFLLYLHENYT